MFNFLKNFKTGFLVYFKANQFIEKNKLAKFFILPAIINTLLFICFIILGWKGSGLAVDQVNELINIDQHDETAAFFLKVLLAGIVIFTYIFVIFLYFALYKFLILTILSPYMAYMSEKVDSIITGQEFNFSFREEIDNIKRGIVIASRNLFFELLLTVLLVILSFVPFVKIIVPISLLIIESYFLGFSLIDYSLERKRYGIEESKNFIHQNKGFAVATGLVFILILMVPIFGVIIAPTYGITSSTLGIDALIKQKNPDN